MNFTVCATKSLMKLIDFSYYGAMVAGMLVILSNLLVVISSVYLVKKGQEPRCMYLLLGNISLSDLIIGFLAIVGAICRPTITEDNINICLILLGTYSTCALTSIISILLIAIDRYIYIIHGLQYRRLMYPKKVKHILLGTWIFGISIGMAPLFKWREPTEKIKICWYILVAKPYLIVSGSLIVIFVVLFVIILYSRILYVAVLTAIKIRQMLNSNGNESKTTLRFFPGRRMLLDTSNTRESSEIRDQNVSNSSRPPESNKWKAVKIVVFVTGSFALTWLPFVVTSIMWAMCDFQTSTEDCTDVLLYSMGFTGTAACINSMMNPIIYAWWHTGFRKAFIKLFLKKNDTL